MHIIRENNVKHIIGSIGTHNVFECRAHIITVYSVHSLKPALYSRVFQNAQKSKDLRGWLAKYVVIHN